MKEDPIQDQPKWWRVGRIKDKKEGNKNPIQDQPKWWRAGEDKRYGRLEVREPKRKNRQCVKDNQNLDQPKWWGAGLIDSQTGKI